MNQNSARLIGEQISNLLQVLNIGKPTRNAAVFFDIDGTVSRNDNLELLISEIIKRDLLPHNKEAVVARARRLWKNRDLDFNEYLDTVIKILPDLRNFSQAILEKITDDFVEGQGSHFYLFPWMFLIRLKNLGYKLVAISGAPSFMAEKYLDKIGLFPWKVHSSKWIFKETIFTGEIDLSILKNKAGIIQDEYGHLFDLNECIALGDTVSDIPMLQTVGKPIAINPTYALAQKAIEQKWTVLLERKDLVVTFPQGQLKI